MAARHQHTKAGAVADFRAACRGGHLDVVRELLALDGDRRIDVHTIEEGFHMTCEHGHLDVVHELLALEGDRRIDVHAEDEEGFRIACWGRHFAVVHELLALGGDRYIDVHAGEEEGFRMACRSGRLDMVHELLALEGDRRIDVHAVKEGGFRGACLWGHPDMVRELLALEGDRRIDMQLVAEPLQRMLAHQLQRGARQPGPDFLGLLRDCVIPQPILEAAMKQACVGDAYNWPLASAQEETRGASHVAQAVMHHALLHALQDIPALHGAGLLTGGASPALDALALCAVLPGAECRHLVGELGVCGAAVPGGEEGRSIGDAFLTYYRECVWRGVAVSVDECVSADGRGAHAGVGALLCQGGRRVPLLMRGRFRAAGRVR